MNRTNLRKKIHTLHDYIKNNVRNKQFIFGDDVRDDEIRLTNLIKELDENYFSDLQLYIDEKVRFSYNKYNVYIEENNQCLISTKNLFILYDLFKEIDELVRKECDKLEKIYEKIHIYRRIHAFFNYEKIIYKDRFEQINLESTNNIYIFSL